MKYLVALLTVMIGTLAADATSDQALRRFYAECKTIMKSSPAFRAKVAKGAHMSVEKLTSACKLELSYSLEQVLAYEHEYLNWERHRHAGGSHQDQAPSCMQSNECGALEHCLNDVCTSTSDHCISDSQCGGMEKCDGDGRCG